VFLQLSSRDPPKLESAREALDEFGIWKLKRNSRFTVKQTEIIHEKESKMETHFENMENHNPAADRVVADLKALIRDSEELIKATASDVSEKAREARARLNAALERANTTCHHLQEQTAAKAREVAQKTDATIRAHPYESIGIGFGVGLLIGVLVARK
jgi:ElaB/YqjD/DUF883 family membrane-anchored ribosome-binding protein